MSSERLEHASRALFILGNQRRRRLAAVARIEAHNTAPSSLVLLPEDHQYFYPPTGPVYSRLVVMLHVFAIEDLRVALLRPRGKSG